MKTNKKVKDTRQLLIESAEFVSKIEMSKDLKEAVSLASGKHGTLIVRNIPCTILNRQNQNGRIYSTELLAQSIKEATPDFKTKALLSQADEHPEGSFVAPSHASHVVINAYIKKNIEIEVEGKRERHDVLFEDWEVLNTAEGKNLRALFEAECSIGTSIRGVGDLNGKYVENYSFLGTDCVGNPSSSTFTRMPVSESVKLEFKADKRKLDENFIVSSSSTNVVKDLDQASALQGELDSIGYGTVTKTSTKVDSETDPKTGAETTMTTLEAETEDEVSDLDSALLMAKRAMLNGKISIDSITIENVKEEDEPKKEASEENAEYAPLNEEDIQEEDKGAGLNKIVDLNGTPVLGADLDVCWEIADQLRKNNDKNNMNWQRSYQSLVAANLPQYILDYADGKDMNKNEVKESVIKEADEENKALEGKKFVLKTPNGFVAMDGNTLVFKNDPKEAFHFIVGKEESGMIHLSGVQKILDAMGVYDVEKYYRKDVTDISANYDANLRSIQNNDKVEIKEPDEEQNLEDAEVSENSYSVNKTPVTSNNTVKATPATAISEDNGSNTKYTAEVTMNSEGKGTEINTIPVSAVDLNSALAEVSNLWEMKSKKVNGTVAVKMIDTTTGETFMYNPANNTLDPVAPQQVTEGLGSNVDDGEIIQDKNKLTMNLDSDHKVEKEFNTPAQANVAKAVLEKDGADGSIMLSEEDDKSTEDNQITDETDKYINKGPNYMKGLVNNKVDKTIQSAINSGIDVYDYWDDDIEEAVNSDEVVPGWYIGIDNIGVSGPFDSKEEALDGLEDVEEYATIMYLGDESEENSEEEATYQTEDEIEEENINEKLYKNPTTPSDGYVDKTLNDSLEEGEDNQITVTLTDIDWDINDFDNLGVEEAEDPVNVIEELPDTITVVLNAEDFDSDDPEEVKAKLMDLANQQAGIRINNATIQSIQ